MFSLIKVGTLGQFINTNVNLKFQRDNISIDFPYDNSFFFSDFLLLWTKSCEARMQKICSSSFQKFKHFGTKSNFLKFPVLVLLSLCYAYSVWIEGQAKQQFFIYLQYIFFIFIEESNSRTKSYRTFVTKCLTFRNEELVRFWKF